MQVPVGSHIFANVVKANAGAKDTLVPFSDAGLVKYPRATDPVLTVTILLSSLMTKAFFQNVCRSDLFICNISNLMTRPLLPFLAQFLA